MRARVTTRLEDGDEVWAEYYAAYTLVTRGGTRLPVPASIDVQLGDALDLRGEPEIVLRKLREALVAACEAARTEDMRTDVGGAT